MDFSYLDDWTDEEAGRSRSQRSGEGYRNIWVLAEVAAGALHARHPGSHGPGPRTGRPDRRLCLWRCSWARAWNPWASRLIAYGADKVLVVDGPELAQYQPEYLCQVLAILVEEYRPEILLLPATAMGSDLAPRLAQRLNTGLISHCIKLEIDMSERLLLGTFPVLGGEMYHTVACPQARPQMATLQPGAFPPALSRTRTVPAMCSGWTSVRRPLRKHSPEV